MCPRDLDRFALITEAADWTFGGLQWQVEHHLFPRLPAEKLRALCGAFERCSAIEARYLARAILGEMRVGAKEGVAGSRCTRSAGAR